MTNKPFKGEIHNWYKFPISDYEVKYFEKRVGKNLGYVICGEVKDHPEFGTSDTFHTSLVVNCDGNQIETLNSRYDLYCPKVVDPLSIRSMNPYLKLFLSS